MSLTLHILKMPIGATTATIARITIGQYSCNYVE
jgi:hypothetical protein